MFYHSNREVTNTGREEREEGKRKEEQMGEEGAGREQREGFSEVIVCPTSLHTYHLHTSLKAVNGTKEVQSVLFVPKNLTVL